VLLVVAVTKHFDDFYADQFDFHVYCLRKVTLRSYVNTLRFEDKIFGQDYYFEAASEIIKIYLQLLDNQVQSDANEPDLSSLNAAERKKAKNIARKKKKAEEKKEADEQQKQLEASKNGEKKSKPGSGTPADNDPLGKDLLKRDPLEEARKFMAKLSSNVPHRVDTWILQYDVAMRQRKPLLSLRALYKARSIESKNSELFLRIVDFASKVSPDSTINSMVAAVIREDTPALMDHMCLNDFVSTTCDSVRQDATAALPMRIAAAKAMIVAKIGSVRDASEIILQSNLQGRSVSVETCRDAFNMLVELGSDVTEARERWKSIVIEMFPNAFDA
jgi:N-alpha-acetyltransferase 15/16, NatA auxiliary subunit